MKSLCVLSAAALLITGTTFAYSPSVSDQHLLSELTQKIDTLYQTNQTKLKQISFDLPAVQARFNTDSQIWYILGKLHAYIQTKQIPAQLNTTYKIIKIIDGDTIDIAYNGTTQRVRMIGLDAPESTTTRYWYTECFGKEATTHLTQLLSWKTVSIELDSTQWEKDKYDRLLAYISSDWININQQMIADWYWREYTYNKTYRYQNDFKNAQISASADAKGVRAETTCAWQRKKADIKTVTSTGISSNVITGGTNNSSTSYTCTPAKTCSSMSSCDEALYYLNTCWVTTIDWDGDGMPCESLCAK